MTSVESSVTSANGQHFRMEGISKSFGGLAALTDVSLNIKQGSIHGLIGPNGAGKTTLFNVISGLVRADSGTMAIDGERIDQLRPHQVSSKGIARSFQAVRVFRSLSIVENIEVANASHMKASLGGILSCFPSERHERQVLRERAEELLATHADGQLYPRRFDRPTELSTGQQRLLEIIRTLISDPKIILLDEPTGGLNPVWITGVIELIRNIRDAGTTIFIIEHNMPVVMDIADQVAVLHFGRVLADGLPDVIRRDQRVIDAYLG